VVEFVHFPLHVEIPPEGNPVVAGTDAAAKARAARMHDLAATEGLPWKQRTMSYNSRLAQELGSWAATKGRGMQFHRAVFESYFGEGKNISDAGVLADIAAGVGLKSDEAKRVLAERSFRSQVDADWAKSFAADVDMVPTFAAGDKKLAGMQTYADLEALVVAAGARKQQ